MTDKKERETDLTPEDRRKVDKLPLWECHLINRLDADVVEQRRLLEGGDGR